MAKQALKTSGKSATGMYSGNARGADSTNSKRPTQNKRSTGGSWSKVTGQGFLNSTKVASIDSRIKPLADSNMVQRKCSACEDEATIQTKLTVGNANDALEKEADDVADTVMRKPSTGEGTLETEQLVQTKPSNGANGASSSANSKVLNSVVSSPGPGTKVSKSVRRRVEPVLGVDLSGARVHSDQRTHAAAAEIHAKAFTNRNNIYLGANQSGDDVRLMAHELTHVVQQSGISQSSFSTDVQREDDESASSGTATHAVARQPCDYNESNPIIWFEYDSDRIRTSGGVNSIVHLMAAIRRSQQHIADAGPTAKIYLYGFASEEGGDDYNENLSKLRAKKVKDLMIDAGIDASNLIDNGMGEDTSMGARPLNRRVEICPTPAIQHIDMPEEIIISDPMDCDAPHKAADLTQYAFLIRCLESHLATTHGPLDILKTLRELYYGGARFDSAACGDSESGTITALNTSAPGLVAALRASKVTSGVDMGHVFTGLEGMLCPRTTTDPAWYAPTVNMANEDFLTWGGDIGSAAAGRVDGYNRSGWIFKSAPPWSDYFLTTGKLASREDLLGDIDSFVFRANLRGVPCSSTKGTRMPSPSTPISRLFLNFYSAPPGMASGLTSGDRFRCFAEAAGAVIRGTTITNKATLVSTYTPNVLSFANVFYLNLARLRLIARDQHRDAILLSQYSREITEMFFDWIESNL